MLKTIKSNKGFTLIELVVTVAIMGIALTAICSVIVLGFKINNNTQSKFNENTAAIFIQNKIKAQIQYSQSLSVYSDPSKLSQVTESNSLYYGTYPYVAGAISNLGVVVNRSAPYMSGTLNGYTCSVTFKFVSTTSITVTVNIISLKNATDTYTLSQTIHFINMDGSINKVNDQSGGVSNPTLIGFSLYTYP